PRTSRRLTPLFLMFQPRATTQLSTLSLHDALPIFDLQQIEEAEALRGGRIPLSIAARIVSNVAEGLEHAHRATDSRGAALGLVQDRKSTRLNSSHVAISYAVFCLKKKTPRTLRYTP